MEIGPNTPEAQMRRKRSNLFLNDSRAIYRKRHTQSLQPQDQNEHQFQPPKGIRRPSVRRCLWDNKNKNCPGDDKMSSKSIKSDSTGERKSKTDLFSMIRSLINYNLGSETQKHNDIAIQTHEKTIRLIEDFIEFDRQTVVNSEGIKTNIKNVIQSEDIIAENTLHIKYKLVPVIEGFSFVKNSTLTEYKFCTEVADINHNLIESKKPDINTKQRERPDPDFSTELEYDMLDGVTMTPTEEPTLKSVSSPDCTMVIDSSSDLNYADFLESMTNCASSTFISASSSCIYSTSTPKKGKVAEACFKVHIDSPMPPRYAAMQYENVRQTDFGENTTDWHHLKSSYENVRKRLDSILDRINETVVVRNGFDDDTPLDTNYRENNSAISGTGWISNSSTLV